MADYSTLELVTCCIYSNLPPLSHAQSIDDEVISTFMGSENGLQSAPNSVGDNILGALLYTFALICRITPIHV